MLGITSVKSWERNGVGRYHINTLTHPTIPSPNAYTLYPHDHRNILFPPRNPRPTRMQSDSRPPLSWPKSEKITRNPPIDPTLKPPSPPQGMPLKCSPNAALAPIKTSNIAYHTSRSWSRLKMQMLCVLVSPPRSFPFHHSTVCELNPSILATGFLFVLACCSLGTP